MEPTVFISLLSAIMLNCCQMCIFLLNPLNQTILAFSSTVTQILLYCMCGELVATKAFEVSEKIYGSHWYNMQDEKLKKTLVLLLNRSQQPCYFSIGNYSPLSMEIFGRVRIIKTHLTFENNQPTFLIFR